MKRAVLFLFVFLFLFPNQSKAWTPNDPLNYAQWGFGAMGMGDAWDYNLGGRPDVKVAVLDTGVDWNLPDFAQTRFDYANAWDYVYGDSTPNDLNGHGSHVTATIAQSTNNGIGASGIAFNTTILPIRVLDGYGRGSEQSVAAGVRRAADAGADVINISLGWHRYTYLPELGAACTYAKNKGSLIVASAGNGYESGRRYPDDPAFWTATLAVGAVNQGLVKAPFSQYAWDYEGPGVTAPGVDIIQELDAYGGTYSSGTSMAAPHVSGLAALIISEAYDLGLAIPAKGTAARADWVRNVITSTTMDLGATGADKWYGYGLVRADNAMRYLQTL